MTQQRSSQDSYGPQAVSGKAELGAGNSRGPVSDRADRAKALASQAFRNARKDIKPVNKELAERIIAAAKQAQASGVSPFGPGQSSPHAEPQQQESSRPSPSASSGQIASGQPGSGQIISRQSLSRQASRAHRQANPFRSQSGISQKPHAKNVASELGELPAAFQISRSQGRLSAPPPKRIRIVLPLLIGVAIAGAGLRVSDMSQILVSPQDFFAGLSSIAVAQQGEEENNRGDQEATEREQGQNASDEAPTTEELNARLSALPPDRLEDLRQRLESLEDDDGTVGLFTDVPEKFQERVTQRLREIDNRERLLLERQILLETVEIRIEEKIAELQIVRDDIQAQIDAMRAEASTRYSEKILRLVKVYEGMKPKQAASVFNTVDMGVLVPVAEKMKEAKLSAILAVMDTERAVELTAALAESDQQNVENLSSRVNDEATSAANSG